MGVTSFVRQQEDKKIFDFHLTVTYTVNQNSEAAAVKAGEQRRK
jgi:hypothetical protein